NLQTIRDIAHSYKTLTSQSEISDLIQQLLNQKSFCFDIITSGFDPKQARLLGLAFSFRPHEACYVPVPTDIQPAQTFLEEFRPVFESEQIEKVGHDLKFDLSVLRWHGLLVRGKLFDSMVAHSLLETDMRHSLGFLAETFLGYTPVSRSSLIGEGNGLPTDMADVPGDKLAEYGAESADVALQLRAALEPLLKEKRQERVFYEIELPLIPVLVEMEFEGIKVEAGTLDDFATQLAKEIDELEKTICRLAGTNFNLNSPRQ